MPPPKRHPTVSTVLITVLLTCFLITPTAPLLLYGCTLSDDLCEEKETCINDGLFGQCWSPESGTSVPSVLRELNEDQLELLQLEVTRLANEGYEWPDQKAQCVFAYFKLSMAYDLQYDPNFCDVRSPANIWALVQLVEVGLKEPQQLDEAGELAPEAEVVPIEDIDERPLTADDILDIQDNLASQLETMDVGDEEHKEQEQLELPMVETVAKREEPKNKTKQNIEAKQETAEKPKQKTEETEKKEENPSDAEQPAEEEPAAILVPVAEDGSLEPAVPLSEQDVEDLIQELGDPAPEIDDEEVEAFDLSNGLPEDIVVQQYIEEILEGRNPDLSLLDDNQLNMLISTVYALKMAQQQRDVELLGEDELAVPLEALEDTEESRLNVLKKDTEHVGETNIGLENVEHKIVKGDKPEISRVVGNRVYLKVNIKDEEQLYPLIEFLQNTIAVPNGLIFDDFQFDNGQLSLRISRALDESELPKGKNAKRIDSVEGVAQAVYKRRKDIARLSGAEVAETGIGIGEDSVPVESADRDWLLTPLIFVCAFTVSALLSVLAVQFYKNRRNYKNNITTVPQDFEGKMGQAYQDLCRQRMSQDGGEPRASGSKNGSTSSWCEEGSSQPSIDISTGHVLLNFLQEYINDSKRMEAQWEGLKGYRNSNKHTVTGEQNMAMNRNVVPYDENLVTVTAWKEGEPEYLNASFVYDDDPRQAIYIAAQSPIPAQISAWWQAVWEQEICLIVNLSTMDDVNNEKAYWPEQGSEVHGAFEVHLVSEHIWSDDYIVRSFYLKNLRNAQTRTITQFHYLSWKQNEVPQLPKTLLEFRRKVNRSFRGRSAPILVHSTDGAGRPGCYMAIDILCARIQRGVKEIDVVASVEHLRDQRPGLVATEAQFKTIYACVAQEVNTLLKDLPQ